MAKSPTTADCSADQLKSLLTFGLRHDHAGSECESWLRKELAALDLAGHRGDILLDATLNPATPLQTLKEIVELAKVADARSLEDESRKASRFLYHLATAACWAHHNARISRRSIDEQQTIYQGLLATSDDAAVDRVLRQAIERMERRAAGPE